MWEQTRRNEGKPEKENKSNLRGNFQSANYPAEVNVTTPHQQGMNSW